MFVQAIFCTQFEVRSVTKKSKIVYSKKEEIIAIDKEEKICFEFVK